MLADTGGKNLHQVRSHFGVVTRPKGQKAGNADTPS